MTAAQDRTDRDGGGLALRGVGKKYGPITVLSDVDLDVRPGEVIALLGENGAGKSTIASIIAGLVRADDRIHDLARAALCAGCAGRRAVGWHRPHSSGNATPSAICRSPRMCLSDACRCGADVSIASSMNRRAAEQLHRLGLDASPTTLVRDLRVAAQQQVEIAKALTLNARLLMFDEPTAALGAGETERLFEQIGRLKAEGVSFIYISHRLDEIARIADRVARPA